MNSIKYHFGASFTTSFCRRVVTFFFVALLVFPRVVSFFCAALLVFRCYRSAWNGNNTEKLTTVKTGNNAKHSMLCHSSQSSDRHHTNYECRTPRASLSMYTRELKVQVVSRVLGRARREWMVCPSRQTDWNAYVET